MKSSKKSFDLADFFASIMFGAILGLLLSAIVRLSQPEITNFLHSNLQYKAIVLMLILIGSAFILFLSGLGFGSKKEPPEQALPSLNEGIFLNTAAFLTIFLLVEKCYNFATKIKMGIFLTILICVLFFSVYLGKKIKYKFLNTNRQLDKK
ncbi:MAG: hypothetical protein WC415_00605 [Patescibacteria group bacterium]|jgi:hypothetical protein